MRDTIVRFYNQHTMLASSLMFGTVATLGTKVFAKSWKTAVIVGVVTAVAYGIRYKLNQPEAKL